MNLDICHIGSRAYELSGSQGTMSGIGEIRNERLGLGPPEDEHHVPGADGDSVGGPFPAII